MLSVLPRKGQVYVTGVCVCFCGEHVSFALVMGIAKLSSCSYTSFVASRLTDGLFSTNETIVERCKERTSRSTAETNYVHTVDASVSREDKELQCCRTRII